MSQITQIQLMDRTQMQFFALTYRQIIDLLRQIIHDFDIKRDDGST
jgi:hypothetical protein